MTSIYYHRRSATAKEWKNGEWYCVSSKTFLTSYFRMTVANSQNRNFAFAFLSFFSPPFFLKKEKANFVFVLGGTEWSC